jgi:iron complex transport system substrate-binding protein
MRPSWRLAVLGLALALSTAQAAIQVTDGRGVAVELPQPPRRIVSLLPSLTETVCALGGCERLVGVDRYSNWPAHVKALPVVGGGIDPHIEAIVALKPDLVLVSWPRVPWPGCRPWASRSWRWSRAPMPMRRPCSAR